MTIDDDTNSPIERPQSASSEIAARGAIAAQHAVGVEAMADNTRHVAELSAFASGEQRAEHIRGIVAATMGQISINATTATRDHAEEWQAWALGLADGFDMTGTQPVGLAGQ